MSFERLDKKREEVEADYKIWKISEEKYLLMLEAIEGKKKTTFFWRVKRSVKTIKTLRWNSKEVKNIEESYEKWLISKAEYNHYLRMNKPFMSKKKVGLFTYIFFWLWVLLFLFYWFVFMPNKTYIEVDDFSEMWDPIQIPVTWSVFKYVEWENIKIDYLAAYTISWRVIATAQYWANLIEKLLGSLYLKDNSLRYRDVWIWWWFLTMDDYVDRFSWSSLSRFLVPKPKSQADWFYVTEKHTWEEISTHFSHNHLIPFNDEVKRLLRWIKKGDYVQIKWYLVSLTWDKWYNLRSSLVRDDTWDWACETILVTDVKWLKEKKK